MQTWGGHSIHVFTTSAGIFDALVWGLAQTGKWGADKQRSWAFDFEGGYQPPMLPALKPWFRIAYAATSGDNNPNDTRHETFFQLLPTPRQYARTPFFNMMNLDDLSGTLILRPHAKITVQSQFDSLRLANPNDLWYSGGGAYQPWTFGFTGRPVSGQRALANLYDTSVEYRAEVGEPGSSGTRWENTVARSPSATPASRLVRPMNWATNAVAGRVYIPRGSRSARSGRPASRRPGRRRRAPPPGRG